jgi:RNA polymerase sigma-70 factor (ECF subfamily)
MWPMLWMALAAAPADPDRYTRSPGTDEALVAAFKGGDVRAFDTLFARYRQPIFGYVYRSVDDPGLAEELTQEVFLKAFVHLRRTSKDTIFKAWIYRIATTTCVDAHRAAGRRPVLVRDERTLAQVADRAGGDPEQSQIEREQRGAVRRALDTLPAHYRQALVLRQLQGLSYTEIGEAMGISVEVVTSLIHRARRAFRAAYSRQHGEIES